MYEEKCFIDLKKNHANLGDTGNVRITQQQGAFVQPLLQWESSKYYISECVLLALVIQHAKRMLHIVNCDSPGCTTYSRYTLQMAQFSKKKRVTEHKMCFDFLCKVCLKYFSF
jgi:hypothetical protein